MSDYFIRSSIKMMRLFTSFTSQVSYRMLLCWGLLLTATATRAQKKCGNDQPLQKAIMRTAISSHQTLAKGTGTISYIPLQFHLISCSGSPEQNWYAADTTLVEKAIDTANNYFRAADIQFCKAGPITRIVNDTFCNEHYYTIYYHYKDVYPDTNVIHVYIPVGFGPSTTVIGYSFATASSSGTLPYAYGMTGPAIAIESSVLPTDPYKKTVLAHELGHFFGLLHTSNYSYITGRELVNGSNGDTTGDFCKDSPAEYGSFYVDSNCTLIKALLTDIDANGDTLHPYPQNLMSDNVWSIKCRRYFTPDQVNRIRYFHNSYLSYFHCAGNPTVVPEPTVFSPDIRMIPNPVSTTQQIIADLPEPARLQINLYNTSGQQVLEINRAAWQKGTTTIQVDLSTIPQGIYYYRIAIGDAIQYKKVIKI